MQNCVDNSVAVFRFQLEIPDPNPRIASRPLSTQASQIGIVSSSLFSALCRYN